MKITIQSKTSYRPLTHQCDTTKFWGRFFFFFRDALQEVEDSVEVYGVFRKYYWSCMHENHTLVSFETRNLFTSILWWITLCSVEEMIKPNHYRDQTKRNSRIPWNSWKYALRLIVFCGNIKFANILRHPDRIPYFSIF